MRAYQRRSIAKSLSGACSVRLSPDADSEGHRVKESNDANGSGSHHDGIEEVTELAASVSSVAAACVPPATSSWLGVGHQEHADVPWFVDLDNACSAAFRLIQVHLAVDSFIAATMCFSGSINFKFNKL